jgi:hypothetical protein
MPLPSREATAVLPQTSNFLPTKIVDQVVKQLRPFINPSSAPSRILPPSTWGQFLFTGTLLPWLWDLDPKILDSRRSDGASVFDFDEARVGDSASVLSGPPLWFM